MAWRLARRFAELGERVRLWIDHRDTLDRLAGPGPHPGIEIRSWSEPFPEVRPAPRVIELFGAVAPDRYRRAMAALAPPPVWINLEYLSCEDWVAGCHGLPSPHPPLTRVFFFPGVTPGTGGVVLEPARLAEWTHFSRAAFLARLGIDAPCAYTLSLFTYDSASLDSLMTALSTLADGPVTRLLAFETPALPRLATLLGRTALRPGDVVQRGALEVRVLSWLPQDDYDRLLWSCDLNLVRGEDSFVRAQLAGRPLLWQPYVQDTAVHFAKLEAFLDHYTRGMDEVAGEAVRAVHRAWSGGTPIRPGDLETLLSPVAQAHARAWRERVIAGGDLAEHLLAVRAD